MMEVLGVDVGGVIADRPRERSNASLFGPDYLMTEPVPGAFAALRQLVAGPFRDNVYLVSKCGPRVQERTLAWLEHSGFYERTGIARDRAIFCRERQEKASICRRLGITLFIDDRPDVLMHLVGIVKWLYLFRPAPKDVRRFARLLPEVRMVDSWEEVLHDFGCLHISALFCGSGPGVGLRRNGQPCDPVFCKG